MNFRSLIQTLAATAVLCTTMAATPAQAASFTFTDPNCSSFSWDGSNLTCNAASGGLSVCTSISGPTSGVWGIGVTLSAVCNNSPTGYVWSGGTCAGQTGISCSPNEASPLASQIYSVTANNATGIGTAAASKTVTWSATAPPTLCTVSPNPTSVPQTGGTAVAFTVNSCVGVTGATTYQLRKGGTLIGSTTTTPSSLSDTPGANAGSSTINIGYSVDVCNGTACMTTAVANVSQAGTGGGGGAGFCSQYSAVLQQDLTFDTTYTSFNAGGFYGGADGGVYVGKITMPGTYAPTSSGSISVAEFQGAPTERTMTLSTQPCDFRSTLTNDGVLGPIKIAYGTSPSLTFSLTSGTKKLFFGQTYYINVRNWDSNNLRATCAAGSTCDINISVSKPK
jgi:hypothetical protein